MSTDFDDVQRIVLVGTPWAVAQHLMFDFGEHSSKEQVLHFLQGLLNQNRLTIAGAIKKTDKPAVQYSLGFTHLGLKRACVPEHVLACFALKAPAYSAGAAQRAVSHLALTGENAPELWDQRFAHMKLHAVLSIHANQKRELNPLVADVEAWAIDCGVKFKSLKAAALAPPQGKSGQWVHFGYRDGLSRIGIEGWSAPGLQGKGLQEVSHHKAGEFVLGYAPDNGADPWIAGPGPRIWPEKVRAFFHNGSFGVMQQIEQRVVGFDKYVKNAAKVHGLTVEQVKGLLCGRTPDGVPLAADDKAKPQADFNYEEDSKGLKCPFGSHIRRMNPRVPRLDSDSPPAETDLAGYPAHFSRARPLLRRGMPYGAALVEKVTDDQQIQKAQEGHNQSATLDDNVTDDGSRGLIGHFFCASIENQYEHLLGQWADRVPLGGPDEGGARDPFIGAHEPNDGSFAFRDKDGNKQFLRGMTPFTRTRGATYLFYPSGMTLLGIANNRLWLQDKKDSREDRIDEDDLP